MVHAVLYNNVRDGRARCKDYVRVLMDSNPDSGRGRSPAGLGPHERKNATACNAGQTSLLATEPGPCHRLRNDDAVAMARGRGAASFRRHPIDQRRNALATHHYIMLVQGRPRDRMKSCSDASVTTLPGFHIRHGTPSKRTPQAIVYRASGLRQEVDLQFASPRETFVPRGRLLLLLITC
jgi:hypothetical protein